MRRRPARPRARSEPGESRVTPQRLMAEADAARRRAYAPYSRFAVGAALLTRDGRIVPGCNVENASFGLSVCAERVALWKAVSEGEREFTAIAVAAPRGAVASPCGACRQVLHELAPNLRVYWRGAGGKIVGRKLDELLASPFRFGKRTAGEAFVRAARRTTTRRPRARR